MKVYGFANVFTLPNSGSVQSRKNEGEGGSGRNQYDPNQSRKDGSQDQQRREDQQTPEQRKQAVTDAVAGFQTDEVAQASGLSAVVEGTGPGLKIAVKDINGNTLRQFTGEEFLKLRQATASNGTGRRGKLLDQKL